MAGSGHETEIKLRIDDPSAAVARLHALGFQESAPRVLEINDIYDTPERSLRNGGRLLRLRRAGSRNILTFKGPAESGRHKSRPEVETAVESFEACNHILQQLGYTLMFRYEKYRTEYARPAEQGVVTVDETPIGWFLEVEGAPAWIDSTAADLGFTEEEYMTRSYGSLYSDYCTERNVAPAHMVFRPGTVT